MKNIMAMEYGFEIELLPEKFRTYPNYPNPFNPITTIKYDVPIEGQLEIIIFNLKGQVVDRSEFIAQPGYYSYIWNGIKEPSGIYFYYFKINSQLKSKGKMLLVK